MANHTTIVPRRFRHSLPSGPAAHLFALGQAVQLKDGFWGSGKVFLVTARLPPSGDTPQYRIRNDSEQFERMAMEVNLESASAPPLGESGPPVEELFRPARSPSQLSPGKPKQQKA
jgi:hypothetical protein